ncbi:MAG TPA: Crp/Fnr family transcriptional regulator [Usitatibacter sp.]|nr:Crp/Fnr family transcriptional regulator [Usitatibacter sp.]
MNDFSKSSIGILSAEELEQMSQHATQRRVKPRTVLMSEGEKTDALYIIIEGKVRAFVSNADGREVVLSTMGPGEYFGELAFDEGPRSASVITLEPCRLLVVPREDFVKFVHSSPAFATHFILRLIGRIRTLTSSVSSLALMDAYGRVARLLLESSVEQEGVQMVPEKLTQSEIASRVGCSREMVSRIFKDLVQGGYISVQPDRIVIHRKPPARW